MNVLNLNGFSIGDLVFMVGCKDLYYIVELYKPFPYDHDVDVLIQRKGSNFFETRCYTCTCMLTHAHGFEQLSLF